MATTTAHIIAIGDEILYGQTLDTNSHFIAKQFSNFNIDLKGISVIPDDEDTILNAIKSSDANIIITTGGLGPTRDDKTKYVIAKLLGKELILEQQALEWTKEVYEKVVKRPMNDLNKNQALAPEGSILLRNKVGTAPGIWSEWNGKIIVNLPGVPYEMKYLITNEVMPKIQETFDSEFILHRFINVINIPESELALILEPFENNLPKEIKLAYLPTSKMVKLRLTTTGKNKDELRNTLKIYTEKITNLILDENIISNNGKNTIDIISEMLKSKGLTLASAESFTSGKIASKLTSISGSSSYFKGGIVAYSPELKMNLLGVSKVIIEKQGVVNEEVAKQMATGIIKATGADIAISSTGTAGPNADEFGVLPGTAFIGIASKDKSIAIKYVYENLDRYEFTEKLTHLAIQELYTFIKNL